MNKDVCNNNHKGIQGAAPCRWDSDWGDKRFPCDARRVLKNSALSFDVKNSSIDRLKLLAGSALDLSVLLSVSAGLSLPDPSGVLFSVIITTSPTPKSH
ncbi:MAG: hypothetical protein KAG53_09865 [Endozoicomonadaceae bacterium]|nr:hypothetical protein [Endozoicomonadaceae bacterium]